MILSDTTVHRLVREQEIPAGVETVFEFFSDARKLEAITPAWLHFHVLTPEPIELGEGTLIDYRLRLHGVPVRWRTRIESWQAPEVFVDRQISGPYRLWHHRHEFEPSQTGTVVRDIVHYSLPLGALGRLAHAGFVKRDLERIFDYRQRTVAELVSGRGPAPGRAR